MQNEPPFLREIEPPQGLLQAVFQRIERTARRRAALVLAAFVALAAGSAGLLALAVSYAHQELYASGFYDYVALFVTDSAARTHWQELLASLGTALPSAAILAVVAAGMVLWWSAVRIPRAVRTARIIGIA